MVLCDYEYHLMSVQYMSYHPRHNYDVHNVVEAHCHVAGSTLRERLMSNLRGI